MRRTLAVVVAVLIVSACGGEEVGVLIDPDEREDAPAVSGQDLADEPVALEDYRDEIVVVNFWAAWCPPCIREMPDLIRISYDYADDGVAVLGVNVQDSATNARRFERDLGVPYRSIFDEPGRVAAAFGGIGPAAMPSTIVLDRDHRVAVRWFGLVTYDQVTDVLETLLAEEPAAVGEAG